MLAQANVSELSLHFTPGFVHLILSQSLPLRFLASLCRLVPVTLRQLRY